MLSTGEMESLSQIGTHTYILNYLNFTTQFTVTIRNLNVYQVTFKDYNGYTIDLQFVINGESAVNPDTVVVIGNAVFNGKTSLTSVTLSNNLEVIFRSAFRNCNHLTEIIIPETVMYISGYAFSGCGSLINIYMDGYIPPIIYDTTFNSSSFNIWIYGESYNDYTSADVWVDLYTLIQLRD